MILGIGIDIQEISKIDIDLEHEAFLRRIFTQDEINHCRAQSQPAECFMGRFTAKEAFMKALGAGIHQGIEFTDIEVLSQPSGAPVIKVHGLAKQQSEALGAIAVHLSISHSGNIATAVVIIER